MREREWESANEKAFETLLENSVSELPPEDVVGTVTPWKKAMNRVLWGIALCAVTLNFWGLDYILPAIGMVLALLGFRALRRENKWFRGAYIVTAVRTVHLFGILVLNTTIFQSAFYASWASSVLTACSLLLLFATFFCLWRGLCAVQEKAGFPPRAGSAAALIVWYALLCVLAGIQYSGVVIALAMLAAYLLILRSLYTLSKALGEAGYAVQPAAVRITDGKLVLLLAVALAVGCVCGSVFGSRYPMDWRAVADTEHAQVEEIKGELAALGFPEDVLNDLTPAEIAACDGALQVVVDVADEPVNDGRTVITEYGSGENMHLRYNTVYDVKELRITGVAVQLSGNREKWMIFHHFLWTVNPGFSGTEAIQLWPTYRDISEGWAADGEMTGRVLYDKGGESYAAPYHSLGSETVTENTLLWGAQTSTDVFASFSFPANGENCRGYVAYPVQEVQDGYIISSWMNYTHQKNRWQYPAVTAVDKRRAGDWSDEGAFKTIQHALQFHPTEDGVEKIG